MSGGAQVIRLRSCNGRTVHNRVQYQSSPPQVMRIRMDSWINWSTSWKGCSPWISHPVPSRRNKVIGRDGENGRGNVPARKCNPRELEFLRLDLDAVPKLAVTVFWIAPEKDNLNSKPPMQWQGQKPRHHTEREKGWWVGKKKLLWSRETISLDVRSEGKSLRFNKEWPRRRPNRSNLERTTWSS